MGIDEHLCVELEGYLVHSSELNGLGGREIKVVEEEMNDVGIKGAQGQNKARWRENKNLLGEFEFDKEKILSVLRENNDTR